ncbi:Calcium uptake protein 1-like, mitochondrial [Hondaea fermentalgiana]|uniref:Calcium uptake protein 1-like, mitochondrial n=1 Tax=Hondaea fermentalgiana TaxID=2315210 RepID=A0A2R5GD66_9STRA|nr:Calcium uptake protein 1-like, mitochondrial [Hondaea fermentalgiana]|eukprot:GBG28867.1 Calcium uptake protein 1-like, mitochondrial [Hondaea fermentalgiana]
MAALGLALATASAAASSTAKPAAMETSTESPEAAPQGQESSFRARAFGRYENQLRRHAPLEKVFNYFASVPADLADPEGAAEGEVDRNTMFMTPEDFVRSIVPFCAGVNEGLVGSANFRFNLQPASRLEPSQDFMERYKAACKKVIGAKDATANREATRAVRALRRECVLPFDKHLEVLKELGTTNAEFWRHDPFVQLVDADGDGLISFREYLLFMSLIDLPRGHLHLIFRLMDKSGNGKLDKLEFLQAMHWICRQSADKNNFAQRQAGSQEDDEDVEGGKHSFMQSKLFAGGHEITFDEFAAFVDSLHDCIAVFKFEIFERNLEGFLRPSSFVRFLAAAHASVETVPACEAFAAKLEAEEAKMSRADLEKQGISKEDFMHFSRFTSRLDDLDLAMNLVLDLKNEKEGLTRRAFEVCVRAVACEEKALLSSAIMDLVFDVMDHDLSGTVTKEEIIQILQPNTSRGSIASERPALPLLSSLFHAIVEMLGLAKDK